jgi:hypothetical protein
VVESFRPAQAPVNIVVPGASVKLRDLTTGKLIAAQKPQKPVVNPRARRRNFYQEPPRTVFPVKIEPHSFEAYRIEH